MDYQIDDEFRSICQEIVAEDKTEDEWAEIESCDMFQTQKYCGGFEADEEEFCFSAYLTDREYWFQLSLEQVQ
ncbi:MAG: hypothetical protein QGG71_14900 [Pirellulaceae bacterium]|jgi:hypothetical protein|nr:hypothetical protein [Pirellulaceae bacterium]